MKHWTSLSFAFAVSLALMSYVFEWFGSVPEPEVRSAVGIAAQISATMLGFLIAALSILASISGHRLLRNMQRTGHYKTLLKRLFWNALAFGAGMVAAIVTALLQGQFFDVGVFVAEASFIFAVFLLADIAWRFWLVLSHLSPD